MHVCLCAASCPAVAHGAPLCLARVVAGDSFGELALSDPKCIRKATVVTDEPTDLLVLGKVDVRIRAAQCHKWASKPPQPLVHSPQDEYTSIVERIHSVEYVEAKTFLRSVPALAALSDDIIARVARVAQKRVFSIGEAAAVAPAAIWVAKSFLPLPVLASPKHTNAITHTLAPVTCARRVLVPRG